VRGHRQHHQLLWRQVAEPGGQDRVQIAQALFDVADQFLAPGVAVGVAITRVVAQLRDT
jgi:hypothetical protein